MFKELLQYIPIEKWSELQAAFETDWPRGVSGYWALQTQKEWTENGLLHDFKVYCPLGDVMNGMIAIHNKDTFKEIIIQCPATDTKQLEEAFKTTKMIDWGDNIIIPFPPDHIVQCVQNVVGDIKMNLELDKNSNELVLYDRLQPVFEDIRLPEDVTFGLLSENYIPLVDSFWANRYEASPSYFRLLIKARSGYGIFKEDQLICWVFINEVGALTHLYTLENHRKRGYAELLLKLVCNIQLHRNKDSFAYCRVGNDSASMLYNRLGFKTCHKVTWCKLKPQK